jgi:hypothetical protein
MVVTGCGQRPIVDDVDRNNSHSVHDSGRRAPRIFPMVGVDSMTVHNSWWRNSGVDRKII